MSKREKAVQRLMSHPKDFGWEELRALTKHFSYELKYAGGSGRKFIHPVSGATLFMHEPHPGSILKSYQMRDAIQFLRQEKHIQ